MHVNISVSLKYLWSD